MAYTFKLPDGGYLLYLGNFVLRADKIEATMDYGNIQNGQQLPTNPACRIIASGKVEHMEAGAGTMLVQETLDVVNAKLLVANTALRELKEAVKTHPDADIIYPEIQVLIQKHMAAFVQAGEE